MSDESPANPDEPEEETASPIIVRKDQILGVFACVPSQEEDGLREWLIESRILFDLNHERGARLALPGHGTFIFGMQHPKAICDQILDYGLDVEIDPVAPLTENSYQPPVASLLELGSPREVRGDAERLYGGINSEHIPELIRMALDEELHSGPAGTPVVYAPVHAWRALRQLRAVEAIAPLLGLLGRIDDDDDDWVSEDLPPVFGAIGPLAIGPIADFMADPAHGQWARAAAMQSLTEIVKEHPEARDDCVSRLREQLERFSTESEELNAFLMCELIDLCAVEVAPLMEQAFAAERVDEAICGDWEDVAIELGLKSRRERPRRPNRLTELSERAFDRALAEPFLAELEKEPDSFLSPPSPVPLIAPPKVGRNDPCPCGSQKKFKKCCGR